MTLYCLRRGGFKINFVCNKIVVVINTATKIVLVINLVTKIECSKTCCVKNGYGNCDYIFYSFMRDSVSI